MLLIKKLPGFLNKCIRYETFWTAIQYLSFAMAKLPYMGVGRNMAYKRKLFFSQNIFVKNPGLLSGDDDLFINEVATSSNTKVQLVPGSFVISSPKKTWDEWLHQKRRHISTGAHYRFKHQLLLGLNSLSHVLFYVSLLLLILYSNNLIEILCIFGIRYIIMSLVFIPAMRKLKEQDLFFLVSAHGCIADDLLLLHGSFALFQKHKTQMEVNNLQEEENSNKPNDFKAAGNPNFSIRAQEDYDLVKLAIKKRSISVCKADGSL